MLDRWSYLVHGQEATAQVEACTAKIHPRDLEEGMKQDGQTGTKDVDASYLPRQCKIWETCEVTERCDRESRYRTSCRWSVDGGIWGALNDRFPGGNSLQERLDQYLCHSTSQMTEIRRMWTSRTAEGEKRHGSMRVDAMYE